MLEVGVGSFVKHSCEDAWLPVLSRTCAQRRMRPSIWAPRPLCPLELRWCPATSRHFPEPRRELTKPLASWRSHCSEVHLTEMFSVRMSKCSRCRCGGGQDEEACLRRHGSKKRRLAALAATVRYGSLFWSQTHGTLMHSPPILKIPKGSPFREAPSVGRSIACWA